MVSGSFSPRPPGVRPAAGEGGEAAGGAGTEGTEGTEGADGAEPAAIWPAGAAAGAGMAAEGAGETSGDSFVGPGPPDDENSDARGIGVVRGAAGATKGETGEGPVAPMSVDNISALIVGPGGRGRMGRIDACVVTGTSDS